MTVISGTKEWAKHSVNCVTGCSHQCRYCYARERALRYRQITTAAEWGVEQVRAHDVDKKRKKLDDRVMFPTTHDITPTNQFACLYTLQNLLYAGNQVLVVSKPHLQVIKDLVNSLNFDAPDGYRDQVTFRFSIGTLDDQIAAYWEPGAPTPTERLEAAHLALQSGYLVGFSMEPALESPARLIPAARELLLLANDVVWIGKMNSPRARWLPMSITNPGSPHRIDEEMMTALEAGQTDACIREVYDAIKDEPNIRWKESYKKVLGLDLQTEPGETTVSRAEV